MSFNTPILFLIFNRYDETIKALNAIKEVKPKFLFIAADGPRYGNNNDLINCKKVRKYVIDNIDWQCEVKTLFREENLGCGRGVSSAITWFFENVEEGIILEDDCVPSESFFYYCQSLLEKYRTNENIYVIGGNNFQNKRRGNASYYFSAYGHIWGWASWRRAWAIYKFDINTYKETDFRKALNKYFSTKEEKQYWIEVFNKMKHSLIDTWDYQWTFTQWINGAINIIPNYNLVENIGFNEDATHTKYFTPGISDRKAKQIELIEHPIRIAINRKADKYSFKYFYAPKKKVQNFVIRHIKDSLLYLIRLTGYDLVKIKRTNL